MQNCAIKVTKKTVQYKTWDYCKYIFMQTDYSKTRHTICIVTIFFFFFDIIKPLQLHLHMKIGEKDYFDKKEEKNYCI